MPRPTASELIARLKRREVEAAEELRDRLKAAQREIAARIEKAAEKRAVATSYAAREAVNKEIGGVYESLNAGIDKWLRQLTEKTALEWHSVAAQDLRGSGRKGLALAFNRERVRRYWEIIHPDNERYLAAVFTDKLQSEDKRALRSAFTDTFRQQVLEGWPAKQTHKELQARWDETAKNLRGDRFVDAAGRPWSNAQYLQMLTRTTLQRTSQESYTDTLVENGFDLVRIEDDGEPCRKCQAWAGLVVSLTGRTKGFPTIAQARDSGWGHPNCMCRYDYVDEDVDAAEIARNEAAPTPEPPDLAPDAPGYKDAMAGYLEAVEAYNAGIRAESLADPHENQQDTPSVEAETNAFEDANQARTGMPATYRLYHGTRQEFEAFDEARAGENTPGLSGDQVLFTSDIENAKFYTEASDNDGNARRGDSPQVVEAAVDVQNPLVIRTDKDPTNYYDSHVEDLLRRTDWFEEYDAIIVIGKVDGNRQAIISIGRGYKATILRRVRFR